MTTAADTDDGIRLVVERLSRPHRSGGRVIERASILAEGLRSTAVLEWLDDHDWTPEADPPKVAARAPYCAAPRLSRRAARAASARTCRGGRGRSWPDASADR